MPFLLFHRKVLLTNRRHPFISASNVATGKKQRSEGKPFSDSSVPDVTTKRSARFVPPSGLNLKLIEFVANKIFLSYAKTILLNKSGLFEKLCFVFFPVFVSSFVNITEHAFLFVLECKQIKYFYSALCKVLFPRTKMSDLFVDDLGPFPRLILYTKSGCIPFINWNFVLKHENVLHLDGQEKSSQKPYLISINYGDYVDNLSSESGDDKQAPKPDWLHRCQIISTVFDPLVPYQNFKSGPDSIPIVTFHGKRTFNVDSALLTASIENSSNMFPAHYLQAPVDLNVPPWAGKKWTSKAAQRTIKFLEQTLDKVAAIENRPKIVASVTGGVHSGRDVENTCDAIVKNQDKLAAVCIESYFGYHTERIPGSDYFQDDYSDSVRQSISSSVILKLPPTIPLFMPGAFLPDDMVALVRDGVHMVDTSIAVLLTLHGMALPSPLISPDDNCLRFQRSSKGEGTDQLVASPSVIINLNGIDFAKQTKETISSSCTCYTCSSGFTRAYLNHLYKRHEINGSMLLQIHNHYALTQFMCSLREIKRDDSKWSAFLANSNL